MVLVQLYYQILFRKLTHPKSQQKRDSYRSGRAPLSQTFGCPEMVGEKLWYISHNDKITAFLYVTKIQHGFMVSKDVHVFFNKFYSIFFSVIIYLLTRGGPSFLFAVLCPSERWVIEWAFLIMFTGEICPSTEKWNDT